MEGRNGGTLTPWEKGTTGNPNGRPKKIYTLLKETGYSKDDIRIAFNELAWMTPDQLKIIFEKKDSPAILKVIAHAYKKAIEKGDYKFVKDIMEQVIGTARQNIDIAANISLEQITGMEVK